MSGQGENGQKRDSSQLEALLQYEQEQQQAQRRASHDPPSVNTPSNPSQYNDKNQKSAYGAQSGRLSQDLDVVERARLADQLYKLGTQRSEEAERQRLEAKRKFEEEKEKFQQSIEEKRKEAERLQQLANQKRLEAQQARQRALEQKEIANEAKRATVALMESEPSSDSKVQKEPPSSSTPPASTGPAHRGSMPSESARANAANRATMALPSPPANQKPWVKVDRPFSMTISKNKSLSQRPLPPPNKPAAADASAPSSDVPAPIPALSAPADDGEKRRMIDSKEVVDLSEDSIEVEGSVDDMSAGDREKLLSTLNLPLDTPIMEESDLSSVLTSEEKTSKADQEDFPEAFSPRASNMTAVERLHEAPKGKKKQVELEQVQRRGVVVITREKTVRFMPRVNQAFGPNSDPAPAPSWQSYSDARQQSVQPTSPTSPPANPPPFTPAPAPPNSSDFLDAILSGKARSSSDITALNLAPAAIQAKEPIAVSREPVPVPVAVNREPQPVMSPKPPQADQLASTPAGGAKPSLPVRKVSLDDIGNKKAQKSPSLVLGRKDIGEDDKDKKKDRRESLKKPVFGGIFKGKKSEKSDKSE